MSTMVLNSSATQFETPALRDWLLLAFGIGCFGVLMVLSMTNVTGADSRLVRDALLGSDVQAAPGAALAPYGFDSPSGEPAGAEAGA